ncbi:hypothetical protein HETIRDRAFT_453799 [Heterobasidion irregulare TC 32-1]|uniref:Uncharacterized protein n=1 Tax=Heterobasidion irregulare (strain TC 32-1) TaxID=747525 RepID=W4K2U0_HETIT|nr:uncharacterized protein HETIRDRAFT_453799 [Heterobasidion irregulare TC 32-1]ETW79371.1 hypothetical protein HETIRDRAFT_453799 [Heterobasidion irregulare TC 32-1]
MLAAEGLRVAAGTAAEGGSARPSERSCRGSAQGEIRPCNPREYAGAHCRWRHARKAVALLGRVYSQPQRPHHPHQTQAIHPQCRLCAHDPIRLEQTTSTETGGRSQHAGAATHYQSPVHMTGARGGPLTVGSRWIWHAWDDARSTDQSGWVRSDHHASQAASPCQTSDSFFILRCADCVGAENWGAQSVRALLSGRALHIRVRERRDHTVCDLARTGAVPARAPV